MYTLPSFTCDVDFTHLFLFRSLFFHVALHHFAVPRVFSCVQLRQLMYIVLLWIFSCGCSIYSFTFILYALGLLMNAPLIISSSFFFSLFHRNHRNTCLHACIYFTVSPCECQFCTCIVQLLLLPLPQSTLLLFFSSSSSSSTPCVASSMHFIQHQTLISSITTVNHRDVEDKLLEKSSPLLLTCKSNASLAIQSPKQGTFYPSSWIIMFTSFSLTLDPSLFVTVDFSCHLLPSHDMIKIFFLHNFKSRCFWSLCNYYWFK